MKLPACEDLAEVLAKDLAPCQNHHVAHVDDPKLTLRAWLDCGDETLATLELHAPNFDEVSYFLRLTMARHEADAWRGIAEMLA